MPAQALVISEALSRGSGRSTVGRTPPEWTTVFHRRPGRPGRFGSVVGRPGLGGEGGRGHLRGVCQLFSSLSLTLFPSIPLRLAVLSASFCPFTLWPSPRVVTTSSSSSRYPVLLCVPCPVNGTVSASVHLARIPLAISQDIRSFCHRVTLFCHLQAHSRSFRNMRSSSIDS